MFLAVTLLLLAASGAPTPPPLLTPHSARLTPAPEPSGAIVGEALLGLVALPAAMAVSAFTASLLIWPLWNADWFTGRSELAAVLMMESLMTILTPLALGAALYGLNRWFDPDHPFGAKAFWWSVAAGAITFGLQSLYAYGTGLAAGYSQREIQFLYLVGDDRGESGTYPQGPPPNVTLRFIGLLAVPLVQVIVANAITHSSTPIDPTAPAGALQVGAKGLSAGVVAPVLLPPARRGQPPALVLPLLAATF